MDKIKSVFAFLAIIIYTIIGGIVIMLLSLIDFKGRMSDFQIKLYGKFILWVSGVKLKVSGVENINVQPCIFIGNHSSLFDIPVVFAGLPFKRTRMIAKKELFRIPIFGWAIATVGFIKIDRENREKAVRSLKKAVEKIKKGTSIMIFPEGTRSPDGQVKEFKKGAFVLAIEAGVPIIPVSISGTESILPKKSLKINSGIVHIIVGEPIKTDGMNVDDKDKLIEHTRNIIIKNKAEILKT
jgi:1-acyl-sn-glycerol-3-phosphate acyltransferase